MHDLGVTARITEAFPLFGGIARRSESGHDGGWRLRLVAVANSGAADRSIGSDSARAAAPGSLAGLPRFSDHADVHRCERPALCGQRRSGWAAAHSCANQWPGCGARPRLGFAARGRGPSPSGLQGRIYLGQNVSEQDVAPVTPICRSADGERQSLYFAYAMCTDRNLVAGVARAQLTWFPELTRLGVHVARGLELRRRRRG